MNMKKTNGVWTLRKGTGETIDGDFATLIDHAVNGVDELKQQRAELKTLGWGDTPALDADIERMSGERSAVLTAVGDWCIQRGKDPLAPFVDAQEKQSLQDAIHAARAAFRRGRGGA